MKETIKKGVLAGVGLVDLSVEMARGAIDALVKTGEITAEQGKKAIDRLQERGAKDISELKSRLSELLGTTDTAPGQEPFLVTRAHLEALEARIARIETLDRRVTELERIVDEITEREGPAA